MGVGVALGLVDPGLAYWEAQCGSTEEAKLMMAQFNALKNRIS